MSVSTGALAADSPRGGEGARAELDAPPGHGHRDAADTQVSRGWWIAAAALVLLHATLAWLRRAPSLTTMNDDAFYIFLARSLRAFDYREFFIVGAPVHAQYPPGYPAFLAVLATLFGERYDLFLAVNAILSAGALAILFATIRRALGPAYAALVVAALAVNPILVETAGLVRSEPLFLMLWATTLWGLAQREDSRGWQIVTGTSAILATVTRSAGLPLIPAVLVVWALRRRWRAVAVLATVGLVSVGLWVLWILGAPTASVPGASYVADVQSTGDGHGLIAGRVVALIGRARDYLIADLPFALAAPTVRGTPADNVLFVVLFLLTTIIGLRGVWRAWRGAIVTGMMYAGMVLIWPFRSARFLAPLLPVMYAAQFVGAGSLASRIGLRPLIGAALLAVMYIATAAGKTFAAVGDAALCERPIAADSARCFSAEQRAFFSALRYVAARSSEGSAVLAAKEATVAMVTGRSVVRAAAVARVDSDSLARYLAQSRVQYVVVGHLEGRDYDLAAAVQPICRFLMLEVTFEPKTYVFRFDPAAQAGDSASAACAVIRTRLAAWGEGEPQRLW